MSCTVISIPKHTISTKKYSDDYIEHLIDILKFNTNDILHDKSIDTAYEELFQMVESLCVLDQSANLQENLSILISAYLQFQLSEIIYFQEVEFLTRLKDFWLQFCDKSKLLRNIYKHLEINPDIRITRKFSIWQLCCQLFRSILLHDSRVREKLKHIFKLIELDRKRDPTDMGLVKTIVQMYISLELYESYFEADFIETTQEYYRINRNCVIQQDIVEYFYYVEVHLLDEKYRIFQYFKVQTQPKIQAALFKLLIEDVLQEVITKLSAVNVFATNDIMDIITVNSQLSRLDEGNQGLRKIFSDYMNNKGREIIFDTKNDFQLVHNLLNFKDRIDNIVDKGFDKSPAYMEAVRVAFKNFINLRKYKPAQFLAKFIDVKMREKQISEELLDRVMVLFRYIHGKDIFEAYYKRYLAKRLLLGKSSSQDAEKYMISKLKLECGEGFTTKLEGMFKDIDLSDGLTQTFKLRNANDQIDFSVFVLTNSFWPTFTKFKINLPESLIHYQDMYQNFYKENYSGRSLEWVSSLDSCLVKATFEKGQKELQVSFFQALVLLLFNDAEIVSFRSMREQLNMNDVELCRTLASFVYGKTQILMFTNRKKLTEEPDHKTNFKILEDDEFTVQPNFTHKLFRIRINQLQYKETEEEQLITENQVLQDRQLQIDAAIVRIMKQNQTMKHADLITMIYTVVKFPVNPNDIKHRIEILIERDFMARNQEDPNCYVYVA